MFYINCYIITKLAVHAMNLNEYTGDGLMLLLSAGDGLMLAYRKGRRVGYRSLAVALKDPTAGLGGPA